MGPHILLDQMGLDKVRRQDKLDVQWDSTAYLRQKCGKLRGLQQVQD